MKKILERLFGKGNASEIKKIEPIVQQINSLEESISKLTDEQIKKKTDDLKCLVGEKNASKEVLNDVLPEAFALVREVAKRELGMRHFDVQLIGAVVLHEGKIAEMRTGEGKTLVATLSLYLNALGGKGAHLVTVNDYLAKYQGEMMGRVYDRLGLTTGIIQSQGSSFIFEKNFQSNSSSDDLSQETAASVEYENLKPCTRKEAYGADIVYGTNNEFGFDYLRDNMAQSQRQLVQRGLNYAIVDEIDSILIDEARTPLIISSAAEESADLYGRFALIAKNLNEGAHFEIDEKARAVSITDEGISAVEKALGIKSLYEANSVTLVHHLEEALKAKALFKKNKDYIVKDGEVVIVDEFTGRLMHGRRYSEGLHQAIEAKEGVAIQRESETLATISFQNLFRLYDKLSGMTGTAATEAEEFSKIYELDVVEIPTNKPMVRIDSNDQIYKTTQAKYNAIVERILELNKKNQPVLVGTISVEKSEYLAKLLKKSGLKCEVLNAKNHEREAKIIAQAGQPGKVTVATNMAGRGVDIILGGNPIDDNQRKAVLDAGGLFVLGTERHESRRIDNQLRGRSGRQGDPGQSQFFISMEDDLMRIFGGDKLKNLMERLGLPDDQPIEHAMISKSIEGAQKRVEGHNFDIRKHLVEYDDVMNKQREVIYKRRRKILELEGSKSNELHQEIIEKMEDGEKTQYEKNIKNVEAEIFQEVERKVCLSVIDQLWIEHLNTMDGLRDSIGLRGYGQVDPLIAYKEESFRLFERLLRTIDDEIISILSRIDFSGVASTSRVPEEKKPIVLSGPDGVDSGESLEEVAQSQEKSLVKKPDNSLKSASPSEVITTIRSVGEKMNREVESSQNKATTNSKVGRNDPCPCGSGKKYKKCCGK
ncbi:MAG: preprotein translocase subunit SecA [candidate division WS2 bacterium ADurb.Bin280]|uniref:Protein translocase subunit SecA n=1 Tax=candidate division WS2 bacterium ADurb.Bin280 TaxID=1852829 RepID=A0A1V5SEZ1_9BACT|nr:MAG: preprotein translocase subunit SecA [candidate division WS2 bacterium ADurb.Bin280]